MRRIKYTPELGREISNLDKAVWKKYLRSDNDQEFDPLPTYRESMYLEADIAEAFRRATDVEAVKSEIVAMIEACEYGDDIMCILNLEKALRDARIRKDWSKALRSVRKGTELSASISWAFTSDDLAELAKLHRRNKYRRKIEDLLTDCNFHSECGAMAAGDYSCFGLD